MSAQLLLALPGTNQSDFRWCWCDAQGNSQTTIRGDQAALQSAITAQKQTATQSTIETWLILPGEKLVTRELDYNEKEKKHLRNLLPFQLEESLIGWKIFIWQLPTRATERFLSPIPTKIG
jgi:general secretion pathway protein L